MVRVTPPVEQLTSRRIGIGLEMCPHLVVFTALGLRHALTLRMPMAVGPRLVLKAMVRLRVSLNITLTYMETSLVVLRPRMASLMR